MKERFRQSMAWLHTWSGLVVGWLMFAIFLTGTASYFHQEISLWMRPELRQSGVVPDAAAVALDRLQAIAPHARRWLIDLPDDRDALAHTYIWWEAGRTPDFKREALDLATGEPIKARGTYGGEFLYYFHFDLNMPSNWGRLIVGAAAIIMLVSLISGVVTHRRIFKDFFTFRPHKASQRSWLDAHNAFAVLALPFHLMITYTGLISLMFIYMPWGIDTAYQGDRQTFFSEASIETPIPEAANVPAPLTPIEGPLEEASRRWGGDAVGRIDVYHPGDASAMIVLTSSDAAQIAHRRKKITFDGVTGKIVDTTDDAGWATRTTGVLHGLHLGRFAEPILRWLYFLSGMAGAAMIASGLVLWVVKRRPNRRQSREAGFGYHVVEGLNAGAIVGLPIAIASYFWANRLLPIDLASRADWEVGCFFGAWVLSAIHPMVRPIIDAWREQLWAAALLFGMLPVLNVLTTERHLGVTVLRENWTLVGFDLTMLVLGVLLGCVAWRVGHTRRVRAGHTVRDAGIRSPALQPAERPG